MQVSSLDVEGGARAVPPEEPHRPADERGGGTRAEAVQVVRVQIVADPDAARRRRASAAAHDGVADLLLRQPVQDLVRVRVPDTAGWRNPVDSVMIW